MSPENHFEERRAVARFMRRLYRQRLTTTSGGNISLRIGEGLVAATPAALDKGWLTPSQIALLDLDGKARNEVAASSEIKMHRLIYAERPEVRAIVHAHPPTATAFTASRTAIRIDLIAETYAMLGRVATAPYALTGTDRLAETVAEAARGAEVILMENHGVTALGETLLQAFDRLELVESAATMTLIARQLGDCAGLDAQQRAELDELMGR